MVFQNGGMRPTYLLGIGLTVLGIGAYQVDTQKGYLSEAQTISQLGLADLYSEYEKNFQHHFEHSKEYVGRGATGKPTVHAIHRQSNR